MAKRRKLELPNVEDLDRIEAEFRNETPVRKPAGLTPPIAQVAAEAAQMAPVANAQERAEAARNTKDAESYRKAAEDGLIIQEIPLEQIDISAMMRDRAVMTQEELNELRDSILKNGLRLPIEVYELPEPKGAMRYGLISGYRRYLAMKALFDYLQLDKYGAIKSIVRETEGMAQSIMLMVEENEIRANLSHFERGRIAALAAQEGVFVNLEDAVNALFANASKAKRSKVRSFALIFEELGDMMAYPEALTERQGLRLSNALRDGGATPLRIALEDGSAANAAEEWAILENALNKVETGIVDPSRGGRPKVDKGTKTLYEEPLQNGMTLVLEHDAKGYLIRVKGDIVNKDIAMRALTTLRDYIKSK